PADRCGARPKLGAQGAGTVLLADRPTLDRSGTHDPDADRWLRVCDPLGAAYLRRGAGEPCLSLVLQARHRRQYSRPFGVLPRTARTLSRERRAAAGFRKR